MAEELEEGPSRNRLEVKVVGEEVPNGTRGGKKRREGHIWGEEGVSSYTYDTNKRPFAHLPGSSCVKMNFCSGLK